MVKSCTLHVSFIRLMASIHSFQVSMSDKIDILNWLYNFIFPGESDIDWCVTAKILKCLFEVYKLCFYDSEIPKLFNCSTDSPSFIENNLYHE